MPVDVYSGVSLTNEHDAESTLQRAGNYTSNHESEIHTTNPYAADYDSDEDEAAVAAMQARADNASYNSQPHPEDEDDEVVIEFQKDSEHGYQQDDEGRCEPQPSMFSTEGHRFLFFGDSILNNGHTLSERISSTRNSLRKFRKEAAGKCDALLDEAIENFDDFKKRHSSSDENSAKKFRAKYNSQRAISRRDSLKSLVSHAREGDYPCF